MSESYRVVAGRIRRELSDLERVVSRAERALATARQDPERQDLYLDSAALNLHDFYAGLERLFALIASSIEGSLPTGHDWHRELLRQMTSPVPQIRPAVLSPEVSKELEEYLGFRHVVRNIYAFEFDLERIARLVQRLRSVFERVQTELLAFADLLEQIAQS
ncbi:MAG: hypothetical protein NZ610_05150 [Candidatus Bipolaricaulota bacterium]|nr:hypothetical protein [Candidatus Bipolaricaulota bacterium]MCS7274773.1 hypothetical protein [Candidatus Bipolaricaulota bacterium]MDW8110053.1 hypothetical protein [Candidatus Bipolaricaulota bacterium]MDW8329478.1 hypothetical protein [Candidatus Bipolaricaulota bacterium]